jgi:hypothetical protein
MPPKRINRSELCMPNIREGIESFPASLSQITPIPKSRVSVQPDDAINDDDPAETPVYRQDRHPVNQDEDEDEDDSTLPESEDNRHR